MHTLLVTVSKLLRGQVLLWYGAACIAIISRLARQARQCASRGGMVTDAYLRCSGGRGVLAARGRGGACGGAGQGAVCRAPRRARLRAALPGAGPPRAAAGANAHTSHSDVHPGARVISLRALAPGVDWTTPWRFVAHKGAMRGGFVHRDLHQGAQCCAWTPCTGGAQGSAAERHAQR